MTNTLILAGFVLISAVEAIEGFISTSKHDKNNVSQAQRIKLYKSNIIWGWMRTALCIFALIIFNIPFRKIGIKFPIVNNLDGGLIFSIVTYIVSGGLFIILLYQIMMYIFSAKYRSEVSKVMQNKKSIEGADIMLPRSVKEKRWFVVCAITAGIGEEVAYRGFLMYLIDSVFLDLNTYIVLAAASIIFGLMHVYQGVSGIIRTGLTGLLIGALYVSSGSLWLPIALHFTIDFAAAFIYDTVE